jgi:hypothetical protein
MIGTIIKKRPIAKKKVSLQSVFISCQLKPQYVLVIALTIEYIKEPININTPNTISDNKKQTKY